MGVGAGVGAACERAGDGGSEGGWGALRLCAIAWSCFWCCWVAWRVPSSEESKTCGWRKRQRQVWSERYETRWGERRLTTTEQ